eukprot:jgi/Bigna1/133045/aug1.19_g7753
MILLFTVVLVAVLGSASTTAIDQDQEGKNHDRQHHNQHHLWHQPLKEASGGAWKEGIVPNEKTLLLERFRDEDRRHDRSIGNNVTHISKNGTAVSTTVTSAETSPDRRPSRKDDDAAKPRFSDNTAVVASAVSTALSSSSSSSSSSSPITIKPINQWQRQQQQHVGIMNSALVLSSAPAASNEGGREGKGDGSFYEQYNDATEAMERKNYRKSSIDNDYTASSEKMKTGVMHTTTAAGNTAQFVAPSIPVDTVKKIPLSKSLHPWRMYIYAAIFFAASLLSPCILYIYCLISEEGKQLQQYRTKVTTTTTTTSTSSSVTKKAITSAVGADDAAEVVDDTTYASSLVGNIIHHNHDHSQSCCNLSASKPNNTVKKSWVHALDIKHGRVGGGGGGGGGASTKVLAASSPPNLQQPAAIHSKEVVVEKDNQQYQRQEGGRKEGGKGGGGGGGGGTKDYYIEEAADFFVNWENKGGHSS